MDRQERRERKVMSEIGTEEIKHILSEVYGRTHETPLAPEDIGDDDPLFDYEGTGADSLEFDSLDGLEVAAYLEDTYGIVAPSDIDPVDLSTPRRIAAFVSRLMEAKAEA